MHPLLIVRCRQVCVRHCQHLMLHIPAAAAHQQEVPGPGAGLLLFHQNSARCHVSRVTIRAGSKHTSSQCCVCQTLHKTCYILLKYQHIYTYNWHNWLLLYAHKKILNISTQQSHGLCWLKYGTRWKYPYYQACILNECGSVFPSSCQQREDWRGWCNGSVMMFLCRLCPWSWDLPIPGQPGPGRLSPVQSRH